MENLYEQAKKKYPILADTDYVIVNSKSDGSGRKLEHFPPNEPGSKEFARPDNIPIKKYGLQILGVVNEDDIAGDIISHNLVKSDPKLKSQYDKFKSAVPMSAMRGRYKFHVENNGEKRPFSKWLQMTGYPELMRGYVFNQFGFKTDDSARQFYGDKVFSILSDIKSYVLSAKPNDKTSIMARGIK